MSSAKLEANRQNATPSTGPTSRNVAQHGSPLASLSLLAKILKTFVDVYLDCCAQEGRLQGRDAWLENRQPAPEDPA